MILAKVIAGVRGQCRACRPGTRAAAVAIAARRAKCEACPSRLVVLGQAVCGVCDCPISLKTAGVAERCPASPPQW